MRNRKTGVEDRMMALCVGVNLDPVQAHILVAHLLSEFKITPLDPWFYLDKPELNSAVRIPESSMRAGGAIANPSSIARVVSVLDDGTIIVRTTDSKTRIANAWTEV